MGLDYVFTWHGIITSLQMLATFVCLMVGYFITEISGVFFMLFHPIIPLFTLNLFILLALLVTGAVIVFVQVMVKDMLGQLGKLKVIVLHSVCALLTLAAAIIASYYVGHTVGWAVWRLVVSMVRKSGNSSPKE
ncbi:hypothetical protein AAVH_10665 [Aphelenchoides avenae]|nr:hypothetical protein AAVH_10665 [Aphelenchus avenae]